MAGRDDASGITVGSASGKDLKETSGWFLQVGYYLLYIQFQVRWGFILFKQSGRQNKLIGLCCFIVAGWIQLIRYVVLACNTAHKPWRRNNNFNNFILCMHKELNSLPLGTCEAKSSIYIFIYCKDHGYHERKPIIRKSRQTKLAWFFFKSFCILLIVNTYSNIEFVYWVR